MEIDEMGVDKMGVDEVGLYRMRIHSLYISHKRGFTCNMNRLCVPRQVF